jgi:FKBP-type peptidyl-prolyl cis-trans isomerase (trigger factor)
MLDAEKQLRFGQQVRGMLKQNVSEDAIRHQTDALRERAQDQANRFLHLYYLLRPVLEKGNVSITQSELYNELTHQLQSTPTEEQIIHEEMKPEIVRGRLSAMVTIHKGLRHLLDQLRPQHNK